MSDNKYYKDASKNLIEVSHEDNPENPLTTGDFYGHMLSAPDEKTFEKRCMSVMAHLVPESDLIEASKKYYKENFYFSSKGDFVFIRNKTDRKLYAEHFMPDDIRKARSLPHPLSYIVDKAAETYPAPAEALLKKGYLKEQDYVYFSGTSKDRDGNVIGVYISAGEADAVGQNFGFSFGKGDKAFETYAEYLASDTLKAYEAYEKDDIYCLTQYEGDRSLSDDSRVFYGKKAALDVVDHAAYIGEFPDVSSARQRGGRKRENVADISDRFRKGKERDRTEIAI